MMADRTRSVATADVAPRDAGRRRRLDAGGSTHAFDTRLMAHRRMVADRRGQT